MNTVKKYYLFILAGIIPFISFSQTGFLNMHITGIDAKCNGASNGSATVTVSGGTAPYTYNWSPAGGTNNVATNLNLGTYKVLVTDHNGSSILDSITISQPPALSVYIDSIIVKPCFFLTGGGSCGCGNTLWAVVNGGTAPYRYNWSPGGQTTDSIFNVCYVEFTVTVTDTNSCITNASLNVVIPKTTGINKLTVEKNQLTVYPNPANNLLTISIPDVSSDTHIEIYDMLGNKVIQQKTNLSVLSTIDVSGLAEGNYFLRLTDNGQQQTTRFSVNR